MQPCHVPQVAALEQQTFSAPWPENILSAELENPLSLWLVAMQGETVVGYVGAQSVLDEADMMNLAVLPSCRRQGIGARLVSELCNRLRQNAITTLTLEVRVSNSCAIRLYKGLGFSLVGQRPNYYFAPREDALIMRKELQL